MSVSGVNNYTTVYAASTAQTTATEAAENTSPKTEEVKEQDTTTQENEGAVWSKSDSKEEQKAGYSINKMSKMDRASLVRQLENDQKQRQQQLADLVQKMISQQTNTYGKAANMWQFLASGNFTVDAATQARAKADIADDGYYGVQQTSQRLFDFASALAGDDVEQMKKMQAAVEKGYKLAEKHWGGKLPAISQSTLEATNKLFEDYYASKASESNA